MISGEGGGGWHVQFWKKIFVSETLAYHASQKHLVQVKKDHIKFLTKPLFEVVALKLTLANFVNIRSPLKTSPPSKKCF